MWLLYLPLVIPALAGAAARLVAARLEPRQATWLLTCGAMALAAPPRRRILLLAAFAATVLLAGGAALEAARDLHALLELAQASG